MRASTFRILNGDFLVGKIFPDHREHQLRVLQAVQSKIDSSRITATWPKTFLNGLRNFCRPLAVNLKDFLANVTTSALSTLNPVLNINNRQNSAGGSAAYTVIKDLTLSADYKFYNYDLSGDAAYFGGKVVYSLPADYAVGAVVHRMDGGVDKLRYMEYRAFASKKIGHADLTIDAININYDKSINGIKDSYTITGAAGYEVNRKLKVGADIEYSRNPDFNNEVRGLVKATYTFDTKFVAAVVAHEVGLIQIEIVIAEG